MSLILKLFFFTSTLSLETFFPCLSSTYLIITCLICLAAESLASAGSPAADEKLFENAGNIQADGSEDDMNLLVYPYERLTVNSKDPETSIDITKREVNPFLRIKSMLSICLKYMEDIMSWNDMAFAFRSFDEL